VIEDPDYDDDGSPKFATEDQRWAAWLEANHATWDPRTD